MALHFRILRCRACGFEMTSAVSISTSELASFETTHARHATGDQLRVQCYDRTVSTTAVHDEETLDAARARGAAPVSADEQQAMPGALAHEVSISRARARDLTRG